MWTTACSVVSACTWAVKAWRSSSPRERGEGKNVYTRSMIVASIGLIVNLISMRILSGGKEDSLNVKGAYLEVWADMLG